MVKRMILMVVVMIAIIAGLGFVKFKQFQAMAEQFAAMQPPPDAVTTIVTAQEEWPATLNGIGTVAAVQGVTVSADLPGIVDRIMFESGKAVQRGDILVQLDTRQEQAQLAGAESQLELARLNHERMKGLVQQDAVSRAEYDTAAAGQQQAEARLNEIRAAIDRKTIRAPFSGVLGIRQVNLGQYLTAGAPVVPLQSLDPIYVNFNVPQQDAAQMRIGRTVRISSNEGGADAGQSTGRISAIDSVIDQATRNVQVQATLPNPQGRLRPGMFVQAQVNLGAAQRVIALPASSINYAPYGDSVFIVSDMKNEQGHPYRGVRQQVVKLGPARGDQIAVLSGINAGEEVVTSGVFKLRNGAPIQVNNATQPNNSKAPASEDK
jgi:membrane fusion protein, multidrug efflux system